MSGQKIGYIRVSSLDQNFERQLEGMDFDQLFTDKASGKDTQRDQLDAMLKFDRKGDTIMDRLARNLDVLRKLVKELTGKGVSIHFVTKSFCLMFDLGAGIIDNFTFLWAITLELQRPSCNYHFIALQKN